MSDEDFRSENQSVVGRTWVDLIFISGYGFIILGVIGLILFLAYRVLGQIPTWVFISIASSLFFIPFLIDRAKEDSKIYVVLDEPLRMTEYRVGSKVPIKISGFGVEMLSHTGVRRTMLRSFEPNTLSAVGSPLGEFSQFEQIRQLSTLEQLSKKLEETLREDRLTAMAVGVEVENKSREIIDWALRFSYGSLIPDELDDALGIGVEDVEINESLQDALE